MHLPAIPHHCGSTLPVRLSVYMCLQVTVNLLLACFDPSEHKEFMTMVLTPAEVTNFVRREAFYNVTMVLTGDVFDFCCD